MIKYDLKCNLLHTFEGWFSSSGDYENQALKGLVTCYTLAIPFFSYSLISTLVFSVIIETIYSYKKIKNYIRL